MQLCEGRPADARERLEKERRTYDLLDSLGIRYWRTDHAPAGSIAQCQEIDAVLDTVICKNLFLCNRQETQFYLLMMPGDKAFKTKDLSAELGVSRLSFAKAEAMEALLDVTPGSVSIMGLMNDKGHRVQLVIDEDVLREPYIGCHPCINTSSLKIATADIMDKYLKAVGHTAKIVHLKKTEEE
ncbi:MAG: prolyl-tRNA synthetase associated domain-containing protein [Clostridiales bacterium]|nr:prolyl-tRNA synthetase associated domain-containing protein [Clostridiales bacterium]